MKARYLDHNGPRARGAGPIGKKAQKTGVSGLLEAAEYDARIKAFADVGDINKNITTIQPFWSQFSSSDTYLSSTPIPRLVAFITALSLKQELWTKTPKAHKIFLHTFVALSKTSPEIFTTAWTKKGNLLLSTAGS